MSRYSALLTSILICSTGADAFGQLVPQLVWETQNGFNIGMPPTIARECLRNLRRQHEAIDANHDGIADLVMVSEDDTGTLQSLQVATLGPEGAQLVLREDEILAALDLGEGAAFFGFAYMGGQTRAIFTDGFEGGDIAIFPVISGEGGIRTMQTSGLRMDADWRFSDVSTEPARLITVFDLFKDGSDDLLIALAGNDNEWRLQIWQMPGSFGGAVE